MKPNTGFDKFLFTLRTREAEGKTDGQLLGQFLSQRDEAAFAALVRRHGPMVFGVCRRVLGNVADAEDAFQATFLVLVRKAASLRSRDGLGDWLHCVARRTALKARAAATRRWAKEQAVAKPESPPEKARDDWLPLLDEELSALPEKYRLPIVLCDLEGNTRLEAAEQLGWPEGTVAGRLARARALLAQRLAQRGVVLSAGALMVALAPKAGLASLPPGLLMSTIQAARVFAVGPAAAEGVISAKAVFLTGEIMKAMFWSKLKCGVVVLLACALGGFGWLGYRSVAQEPDGALPAGAGDKAARIKPPIVEKKGKVPTAPNVVPKKTPKEGATSRELMNHLQMYLDTSDLQHPMTLKELLGILRQKFQKKGIEMGILIDTNAFKESTPDAASPYETAIVLPMLPKRLTGVMILRIALAHIPTKNAAMLLRNGGVEITTESWASLQHLLEEKVMVRFENQPFVDVVQDLADMTGFSYAIDPRVKNEAQTPITAFFGNDMNLDAALRIISEMAGLKVVNMQPGLYFTTPAAAKELDRDRQDGRNPRLFVHPKAEKSGAEK